MDTLKKKKIKENITLNKETTTKKISRFKTVFKKANNIKSFNLQKNLKIYAAV